MKMKIQKLKMCAATFCHQCQKKIQRYFQFWFVYVISCGVLNAYLDPGLRKVNFEGHFLSHEDVRVPRLGEQRLKNIQLRPGESRPLATLFAGVTWIQPLVFRFTKSYYVGC
jgi:hypothetical protein